MPLSNSYIAAFDNGKTNAEPLRGTLDKTAMARSLNGTRCSRSAFIRSAGIVHTFAGEINLTPHLPMVSPVRTAVRMVNSRALAESESPLSAAP